MVGLLLMAPETGLSGRHGRAMLTVTVGTATMTVFGPYLFTTVTAASMVNPDARPSSTKIVVIPFS